MMEIKNNLSTIKKDLNSIPNAIVFVIGTLFFILSSLIGLACMKIIKFLISNYESVLLLSIPCIIGGFGLLVFKNYLNKRNDL